MQFGWADLYLQIVLDLVRCTIPDRNISREVHRFVGIMQYTCAECSSDNLLYLFIIVGLSL